MLSYIMNPTEERTNDIYTDQQRESLIKKYEIEGFNIKESAILTNIDYDAAKKIIGVFKKERRRHKKKRGKVMNQKMTPEIEEFIENSIEINSQITLTQIKSLINERFSISVCLETIRRVIYKLKITLKKASRTLENVNSEISKIRRKEYARNFLNEDSENDKIKIFIDESGFNLHLRRTMARSPRGAPAFGILPSVCGRNVSLISAITRDEVIFPDAIVGSVDSNRYKEFFRGLVSKCEEKKTC